jgi:hypothetical protein
MAVYFLRSKHISRGNGSRVTRASAYRAGERIADERTSEVYDHSDRRDVVHKEVVVPADLTGRADMAWTQDRSVLWNAAEYSGLRRNSRLAREWLVLLPTELSPQQRIELVHSFATDLADRYRAAVDVCIHTPRPTADRQNHHAHLLMTMREVTPDGLGRRTSLEVSGRQRYLLGIEGSSLQEYLGVREGWARRVNQALEAAGLSVRVDHRSYERQGIDREPVPNIPEKVLYAERAHGKTSAGEAIRARYRERVSARRQGPAALAAVRDRQTAELKARARADFARRDAELPTPRWGSLTREERNERRRHQYRERRALEKLDAAGEARRREAKLKQYYVRMRENPEAIREARERWRRANTEEINRKQREYRARNKETLNEKRRVHRRDLATAAGRGSASSLSNEMPSEWKAYRDRVGAGPTAEESAQRWRNFRDAQHSAGSSPSDEPAHKPEKNHDREFGL